MAEDDFKKLVNDLEGFAEDLENVIETTVGDLATEVNRQLQQNFSNNLNMSTRAGGLAQSLNVSAVNGNLSITMNDYGYFQIFGVVGKKQTAFALNTTVAELFNKSAGDKFKFTKTKHPGLAGIKNSVDLIESIPQLIIEAI
jgi:hypothetical protein